MDKTADCRNKCASSADMLSCLRDCVGKMSSAGPVSPNIKARAATPRLFGDMILPENRKSTMVKLVVVIAVVAGGLYLYKRSKKTTA